MRNLLGLAGEKGNEYMDLRYGQAAASLLKSIWPCLTGCRKVKADYGIHTCAGPGNDKFPRDSF